MVHAVVETDGLGSPRVPGSTGQSTLGESADLRCLTIAHAPGESPRQRWAGQAHRWFASELCVLVVTPLALLLLLTLWFRWTSWDVEICRMFYGSAGSRWPWRHSAPCTLLYQYGVVPGYLLATCGLGVWLLADGRDTRIAKQGLFCALVVVLGPGALVNGLFKPHWHRPRPNQIVEFGGTQHFVPVPNFGQPNIDDLYRSFPSGHASMGFCLIAPAFLLRRQRPAWALTILIASLTAGLLLGTCRVVQGKHFPSDVIWSAGIVYFTAVLLFYSMEFYERWRANVAETHNGLALRAAVDQQSVDNRAPIHVSASEYQLRKAS